MKNKKKTAVLFILILTLGMTSMSACGFLGFGNTASWKEEVLLHDGSKIIVKRWQRQKGRYEIGQTPPIGEQTITFTIPGTKKVITWHDEYCEELGRSNFDPLALHILNGVAYIIVEPNLCLSYNKWGRPNPPYVIFKYEGHSWKRIPLGDLPGEFKNINLIMVTKGPDEKKEIKKGFVSSDIVKKLNSDLKGEEYKTIVRTPIIKKGREGCRELVKNEQGTWIGIGRFKKQPSYEACLNVCLRERFIGEYCPCNKLFNQNKKGE